MHIPIIVAVIVYLACGSFAQDPKYEICSPENQHDVCLNLESNNADVRCNIVNTRVDCAIKLSEGKVDIGIFSEEEAVLLAQQLPELHVIATIRNSERMGIYAFEAVLLVSNGHTASLPGLRGDNYCHPGFYKNQQWSPRVLKAVEDKVLACPQATDGKTAEELHMEEFGNFFTAACRPGYWSANASLDAALKKKYPKLCELCEDDSCKYNYDTPRISDIDISSSHVGALQCLTKYGAVAFVAWHHAREFFLNEVYKSKATSYAVMCPDGSMQTLTNGVLHSLIAPCAFVRQPWRVVLARSGIASYVQKTVKTWWPEGKMPDGDGWQATLFSAFVGGINERILVQDPITTIAEYVAPIRNLTNVDTSKPCLPAHRWCTISAQEQRKCLWLRAAAHNLGIEPTLACHETNSIFQCLKDVKENKADFIAIDSNYGYLARRHYGLSPVKIVQNSYNSPTSFSRVVALLKESTVKEGKVSTFEHLRGKNACFPEFGGISYVSFVRAAHEHNVVPSTQCHYGRAVGEFFGGACAPGAVDAAHSLAEDTSQDFNSSKLCSTCRLANGSMQFTCAWDKSNKYFGNAGALKCLADPNSDVAFVETGNLDAYLRNAGLETEQVRALCRNNSLAVNTGIDVDNGCLLAHVVDSEVLTRRNDSIHASLSSLLDTLDEHFGYKMNQLINFELFSKFDDVNDLLFEDSAVGFLEPSDTATNLPARDYVELFEHLESCTETNDGNCLYKLSVSSLITVLCLLIVY